MDTQETLLNRRSIRAYLKDPVAPETIKKIMTAAIWAPSGSNTQPWRFYVATGAKRDQLVEAMVEASGPEAPTVDAFDELVGRLEKEANEASDGISWGPMNEETMTFARFGSIRFYQAPVAIVLAAPKQMSGSAQQSLGAAMENLLLAAHAEGLGTCWLGMPLMYKEKIIEVLNIPEDEVLITSASLGYPDTASPFNRMDRMRLPYDETVHLLS
ncbi:MAG: nitroreductase [Desulfobacterales bacterium]